MLLVGNLTIDIVDKKKALVCVAVVHALHYTYMHATLIAMQPLLARSLRFFLFIPKGVNVCSFSFSYAHLVQVGAISYAAAVATAFGVKSCIVTAASSDANLTVFEGHELHIVSTQESLTFEHTYTWWGESLSISPVIAMPLSSFIGYLIESGFV